MPCTDQSTTTASRIVPGDYVIGVGTIVARNDVPRFRMLSLWLPASVVVLTSSDGQTSRLAYETPVQVRRAGMDTPF